MGESCPRSLTRVIRQLAAARGRSAPQHLLAASLRHRPTGNEEKTTRAAWKSPPGSRPESDSVGLAGELPSHPSARTRRGGLGCRKQHSLSAQTEARKLFNNIDYSTDTITSCLKTCQVEAQHIRWRFKAL